MPTPPDKPTRPLRRFSAIKPAARRKRDGEDAGPVSTLTAPELPEEEEVAAAPGAEPDAAPAPASVSEPVPAVKETASPPPSPRPTEKASDGEDAGPVPTLADPEPPGEEEEVATAPVAEPDAAPAPAHAPEPAPAMKERAALRSAPPPADKASDGARIAKVMARAGLCSRRDAESWIAAGRVAVNGVVLKSPALDVGPSDVVAVDGYPINKPERTRLFLFNKARGLVTTSRDPEGRPTVFDALPPELPRLMTVGRLDINTEGLLLLTNDGGLARLLELPSTGWIRRYRVRANGSITPPELDALAKGITVDGVVYAGIAAKLDRVQGANLWLTMGLKEGKNREIKRVLEHLGLAVTRLIRISFGPFQLGELADNAVEEVRTRVLRDQLGSALVKQAGLDLDGPVAEAAPAPSEPPGPARKRSAVPAEPRRRTERAATADRRGRKVSVERISTQAAAGERTVRGRGPRPASPDKGTWRADAPAAAPDRARPGSRQNDAAREDRGSRRDRPPAREGGDRPPRGTETGRGFRGSGAASGRQERDDRPRSGRADRGAAPRAGETRRDAAPSFAKAGARPGRSGQDGGRPFRARDEADRGAAPRAGGPRRDAAPSFAKAGARPERSGQDASRPFRARDEADSGSRGSSSRAPSRPGGPGGGPGRGARPRPDASGGPRRGGPPGKGPGGGQGGSKGGGKGRAR